MTREDGRMELTEHARQVSNLALEVADSTSEDWYADRARLMSDYHDFDSWSATQLGG